MRGIFWFKKDLRLSDNPALYQACQECQDGVVAIYIIDDEMWQKNDVGLCQINFILRSLPLLQNDLARNNIPLIVRSVTKTADIPQTLFELAEHISAEKLFFNEELEFNECQRDQNVMQFFAKKNIQFVRVLEQFIIPNEKIRTQQGAYFKVFTPFKREWINVFLREHEFTILPAPRCQSLIKLTLDPIIFSDKIGSSDVSPDLWPAGERAAQERLQIFLKKRLSVYDTTRDFPALAGTSQLSPYLALGMISGRMAFKSALAANHFELTTGNAGALTWMSELIWREFYRYILVAAPRISRGKAYQLRTEALPWGYDATILTAWQQGQTGFPIVDAAMRQLKQCGWMHNRLRMIVAMFLSKNCFLNWRLGEKYFANHLVDFDFPSNNGGWQWSASTGTDAVPYFRIFNPITQSERFDASGDFIRTFCEELRDFDSYAIHDPHTRAGALAKKCRYPEPIINYNASRQRVLAAFKALS